MHTYNLFLEKYLHWNYFNQTIFYYTYSLNFKNMSTCTCVYHFIQNLQLNICLTETIEHLKLDV